MPSRVLGQETAHCASNQRPASAAILEVCVTDLISTHKYQWKCPCKSSLSRIFYHPSGLELDTEYGVLQCHIEITYDESDAIKLI
jgi:hypothetical protein